MIVSLSSVLNLVILTIWSPEDDGKSEVDPRGADFERCHREDLVEEMLEKYLDPRVPENITAMYNEKHKIPKSKRKKSRLAERSAEHCPVADIMNLRYLLPAFDTLVPLQNSTPQVKLNSIVDSVLRKNAYGTMALLHVEKPVESKYQDGYTISKCYCCLALPGPEHKGYVYLRRMACLCADCEECKSEKYLDCKHPSGKCGPWIKCRLVHHRPCRKRPARENSKGKGPAFTVNIFITSRNSVA